MGNGIYHNIHIANDTPYEVEVIIAPNIAWAIIDVIAEVLDALNSVKRRAIRLGLKVGMNIIRDLKDGFDESRTVHGGDEVAYEISRLAKDRGIRLRPREARNVHSTNISNPMNYFTPSAWGNIVGASTINLTINSLINGETVARMAQFNTNTDHSWIVQNTRVIRARYGTIWQPDIPAGNNAMSSQQVRNPNNSRAAFSEAEQKEIDTLLDPAIQLKLDEDSCTKLTADIEAGEKALRDYQLAKQTQQEQQAHQQ